MPYCIIVNHRHKTACKTLVQGEEHLLTEIKDKFPACTKEFQDPVTGAQKIQIENVSLYLVVSVDGVDGVVWCGVVWCGVNGFFGVYEDVYGDVYGVWINDSPEVAQSETPTRLRRPLAHALAVQLHGGLGLEIGERIFCWNRRAVRLPQKLSRNVTDNTP